MGLGACLKGCGRKDFTRPTGKKSHERFCAGRPKPAASCASCLKMDRALQESEEARGRMMRANERLLLYARDQGWKFPPLEDLRRLYPLDHHTEFGLRANVASILAKTT